MELLKPRRIVICGVGGIGSWLAEGVVRMLEFKAPGSMLVLIDGDEFEFKNAERQSFEGFGNKALSKASELQGQFPGTYIIPIPKWVGEKTPADEYSNILGASDLLEEETILFAVVDNVAARKILFDAARNFDNIDVFTGGNDEALYGSIYHYQRRDGCDVTDHPVEFHAEYVNPPDRNPAEMSCQERARIEGGVQLISINMAVAAVLLGRLHKTIFEGKADKEAEIHFDLGLGKANSLDRSVEQIPVTTTA